MERIIMGQIKYAAEKLVGMFKTNPIIAVGVIMGAFAGTVVMIIGFVGQKAQELFQKIFKLIIR